MGEAGEGISVNPDKGKRLDIRKFIPVSAERRAQQQDNEAIYNLALERVQSDKPQSYQHGSSIVGPGSGLRVDYYDIGEDPESIAGISMPDHNDDSLLLFWKDNRSYRVTKNNNGTYDVRPESGFDWHKKGREEQGLLTKKLELTAIGRVEVLKVLGELPDAKRWYREPPHIEQESTEAE